MRSPTNNAISQSLTQAFIVTWLKVFYLPTGLLNLIKVIALENKILYRWASQAQPNLRTLQSSTPLFHFISTMIQVCKANLLL
ncbi:hypothetical protein CbuD7D7780_10000 [Coxiella burnetii]|nr:hypothetical protein CbuD7E6568_09985 [Coxiella burnetii]OYK81495.1 hypothetical protein CbuD7D7780_10000 [Coxiella burnetii]PHH56731.1 hypothetical protein CRH12_09365 [Coxiella burnetii]